MRWEEPHHPGPLGFNSWTTVTHFPPLCNTDPNQCPIAQLRLQGKERPSPARSRFVPDSGSNLDRAQGGASEAGEEDVGVGDQGRSDHQ